MVQMPWMSSSCRVRLLTWPPGAKANIVAAGTALWSSPRVCPASWVTVFCTSYATQPTYGPPALQGGPSAVVNVNPESLSSMSASRIWPVDELDVVVVVAIAVESPSQQSYLFEQPPSVRHGSPRGTAEAQLSVRQRTRGAARTSMTVG